MKIDQDPAQDKVADFIVFHDLKCIVCITNSENNIKVIPI